MANGLSQLDGQQVLRASYDETSQALGIVDFSALIPAAYDYMSLTYVAAGNGAGEVETVTYKTGGASGTTVAVLTLTYDSSSRVETITRS